MEKKRLIIIDGNAIIHRAYHALPPLTTKKGELVNAVYGFLLFFLKSLKEFKPDFILAAFDFPAPTFRHKKYELYKATRKKAPDDLYQQIPKTKEILKEFNIQILEKEGYEADDIIGTVAKSVSRNENLNVETIILSGDLDNLQLVDPKIKVFTLKKGIKDAFLYDQEKVKERYGGLNPEQLLEFKSLRGDPSDNIPGVLGVGEKTAVALVKEFGSVENLYKEFEENSPKSQKMNLSLKKKLLEHKDKVFLSKFLADIDKKVPIEFNLEKCRWGNYNEQKIIQVLNDYEFKSLIPRFKEIMDKGVSSFPKETEAEKQKEKQLKII